MGARCECALTCRLNEAHRQTRHAQVEADVAALTRRIVATGGADALAVLDGPAQRSGRSHLQAVVAAVPASRGEVRSRWAGALESNVRVGGVPTQSSLSRVALVGSQEVDVAMDVRRDASFAVEVCVTQSSCACFV